MLLSSARLPAGVALLKRNAANGLQWNLQAGKVSFALTHIQLLEVFTSGH